MCPAITPSRIVLDPVPETDKNYEDQQERPEKTQKYNQGGKGSVLKVLAEPTQKLP